MLTSHRLAFVALALLLCRSSFACSCAAYPSPREARTDAHAVFEGTVVRRWPVLRRDPTLGVLVPVQRYLFSIRRAWKGVTSSQIEIVQGTSNCSWRFDTGRTYLVFAVPHDSAAGELDAFKCAGPTGEAASNENTIQALGAPTLALSPATVTTPSAIARAAQHIAVYFWSGIAVILASPQRPRLFGWWPFLLLAWLAFLLTATVLAVSRVGKRRRQKIALIITAALVLSLLFVLGNGIALVHQNAWFRHLLE